MKKGLAIISALLLMAQVALAGKGLIVEQKYTTSLGTSANITVTWYITDNAVKMKMTFSDGTVNTVSSFIPDKKTASMLSYNEAAAKDGKKTYFSVPVDKIHTPAGMDATNVKVTRTGETQNLSGFTCEKVIVTTTNSITEMWVTKDFKASYFQFAPYFRSSYEMLGLSQEQLKGFPLKSETKDLTGKVLSAYDLLSAKQAEISDSEFQVPAGYEKAQ